MEGLMRQLFRTVLGVELPDPFPRMTYAEAMRRYGSDKPDLRIPLELVDVGRPGARQRVQGVRRPGRRSDGRVAALRVPAGGEKLSRKQIDDYTAFVARYGAKGLAYVKVNDAAKRARRAAVADPQVPLRRRDRRHARAHRRADRRSDVLRRRHARSVVNDALGALRLKVGHDLGLVEAGWQPLWVVDFPMFEWDADAEALGGDASPVHRAGQRRCRRRCEADPGDARSHAPTTWC